MNEIKELKVLNLQGNPIQVGDLVHVTKSTKDKSIYRKNQKRVVFVLADLAGRLEGPVYAMMDISEKLNSKINIIRSLNGLAKVYDAEGDLATSMKYYLKAIATAEEIKASPDLKALYQDMAIVY